MQETGVQSLDWEDPLEKEMATHSSTFAWRIPWTEELDELRSTGHKESDTTERLHFPKVNLVLSLSRLFNGYYCSSLVCFNFWLGLCLLGSNSLKQGSLTMAQGIRPISGVAQVPTVLWNNQQGTSIPLG